MPVKTAYSTKETSAAVAELKHQCGALDPRVVLCFASTKYGPADLSRELKNAFPNACVAGCSTAGEIVSGQMLTGSVVAMFLDSDVIEDACCAEVRNLRGGNGVRDAFHELESHFGAPLSNMDIEKYVGLVLMDGMSAAEERLMEEIGDRTDLFFVGGSAGDDLKFERTWVLADGQAHTDAAVLVLLKVRKGFDFIKTQSFVTTGKTLVAAEVDRPSRRVAGFNGKSALEAYAEAVGVPSDKAADEFMRHPLGLMVDGQPFVRSPQRVQGDALAFYCQIVDGAELELLSSTDIVADTRSALEAKKAELGEISGIIDFDCILRTLELRAEQRTSEYGAIFGDVPVIGFSTYGEAYLGHLNQTSTMLILR